MHSEQNTYKPNEQRGANSPAKRMVRSLLGLPESDAGRMHGQVPVPPGAFRYQLQSGPGAPFIPSPLSGQESELDLMDKEEERMEDTAPDNPPQVDRQAADDKQPLPQTSARSQARPVTEPAAAQAPRPGGAEVAQHAQMRPAEQMMADSAQAMSVARGTEEARQPAPDSEPTVMGEKNEGQGNRQEIAIPGRSTVRQVFAAPLPAGQARHESVTKNHGERSAPLSRRPEAAQPTADRPPPQTSRPLPATAQGQGHANQEATTAIMPAIHATGSAAGQRGKPILSTADKIAERTGMAEFPAAAPENKANIFPSQQGHPPTQTQPRGAERLASATPARRPDEDGVRKIEELRRTFYELVSKKTTITEAKVNEQTTAAEAETPPQPPLQQIVVINRTSGSRSRSRVPAAFWERSCMARTTLKMIR